MVDEHIGCFLTFVSSGECSWLVVVDMSLHFTACSLEFVGDGVAGPVAAGQVAASRLAVA